MTTINHASDISGSTGERADAGRTPIVRNRSGHPDVYQTVTDRIVAALEAGTVPWVRPWSSALDTGSASGTPPDHGFPRNGYTGRQYAGINVLLLWLTMSERGYVSNEWFTMRQANALGARVRKGEHGTLVTFWRTITVQDDAEADAGTRGGVEDEPSEREVPFLKHYTVFSREQLDGLPAATQIAPQSGAEAVSTEQAVSETGPAGRLDAVDGFVERTGAVVLESATTRVPCYNGRADRIHMPPLAVFHTREDFYASLLHEVAHWTGHVSRLARPMTGGFGTPEYAREELTAEIASAFLSADFALAGDLQHPEYVGHWIRVLTDDNRAVFRAAREARQAVAYLYDLTDGAPGSTPEEAQEGMR